MEARIDKWLWSVRIFKTRTIAADACKKGRISVNGVQVKPSKTVKEGDTVQVKKPPVTYSFKVLQAIENRVGAKLVPDMMENITPKDWCQTGTGYDGKHHSQGPVRSAGDEPHRRIRKTRRRSGPSHQKGSP